MNSEQMRSVATKLSHSDRFRKIVVVLVGAVLLLGVIIAPIEEQAAEPRIHTIGDGLWYAVTTMTGAGHGDMVPVTPLGRTVSSILQIFGVALFGSVIAFVSVELLRYQEDFNMRRLLERFDLQSQKIDELKKEIGYLVKK